MVRRFAACGVLAFIVALVGVCAPAFAATNYGQWRYPNTVRTLQRAYPATHPITYVGHDPSARLAVDFMLPRAGRTAADVARGYTLANRAVQLARTGKWHIHYVVYRRHIWNVQRAREGWRVMPNRGSWTQNHMDHVHVSMW